MNMIFVLFLLFASTINSYSQHHTVWQIGKNDQSASEFALGPYDYSNYNKVFGLSPVVFDVGRNKEKADFPFIMPGAADAWAGNKGRKVFIRFGINDSQDPGKAQLVINYVDLHGDAPALELSVNNRLFKIKAPIGGNNDYFTSEKRKYNTKNLKTVLDIPENVLKKGDNLISIASVSGSWAIFDNLELKSVRPVKLIKTTGGITILKGKTE